MLFAKYVKQKSLELLDGKSIQQHNAEGRLNRGRARIIHPNNLARWKFNYALKRIDFDVYEN